MRGFTLNTLLLLAAFLSLIHNTCAHSWNEQLAVIGSNGSYTGPMGYPRNYVARTDAGFNGDSMDYLLPPLSSGRTRISGSELLCHPNQRVQTQSAKWPRLQVSAGSAIAMKYLENGHVSLPTNQLGKQANGGTVYVFGTTSPSATETIGDVLEWTKDGTGGDKRGFLLAANDFDDLRCYQLNGGAISTQRQAQFPDSIAGQPTSRLEQWCETDVVLPTDASIMQVGKLLTVYWVWDWQTVGGVDPNLSAGKDEYYTTCNDLEIVASVPEAPLSNFLMQQDPQTKAVTDYMSRSALINSPRALASTATTSTSGVAAPTTSAVTTSSQAVVTTTSTILGVIVITTAFPSPSSSVFSSSSMPTSSSTGAGSHLSLSTLTRTFNAGAGIGMSYGSSTASSLQSGSPSSQTTSTPTGQPTITYVLGTSTATPTPSLLPSSTTTDQPQVVVLTALITVVVTIPVGAMTVVTGEHVITFSAPGPAQTSSLLTAMSFRA